MNKINFAIAYSILISYRMIWIVSIALLILSIWQNELRLFTLLSAFSLFSGIYIHEIAHILTAKLYHPAKSVHINYQNNHLIISYPFQPVYSIVISASGPLVNILLALIIWGITQNVFNILVITNLILGIGNLIPPSNDGKEIAKGLYTVFKKNQ